LTGAKHPALSTNHLTDIDKTTHNYNKPHKNLNNQTRKPLTYVPTSANETKAWFKGHFTASFSGISVIKHNCTYNYKPSTVRNC